MEIMICSNIPSSLTVDMFASCKVSIGLRLGLKE
jgi:hypothetical protein